MQSQSVQTNPRRSPGPDAGDNRLLAAMIEAGCRELLPALESVSLRAGDALYEPGSTRTFAYFPTSAIVCVLHVLEDGTTAEFSMAGNEGMLGIPMVLGAESTPNRAVVLCGGHAYRLGRAVLMKELERRGVVQHVLLHYIQAVIAQITQTAACNRYHSLEQRLCRWILMCLDRLPSSEFSMTHELIANMLGVRREGITQAAGKLQTLGIIQYSRGHIAVLDRAKLEASACECYSEVKREYDRLSAAKGALAGQRWTSRRLTLHAPSGPRAPGTAGP